MLFTLGVTALWTASKAVHGSDLPIVAFAITGYSAVLLWRNMPARCIGAVAPNLSLLYHRNVRPIDIYLSRDSSSKRRERRCRLCSSCSSSGSSAGWICLEDALQVAAAWLMLAWFGAAFALFLGALSEVPTRRVEKLWHPASYILFPLSGAAFLVDALPQAAQKLSCFCRWFTVPNFCARAISGRRSTLTTILAYMAIFNVILTLLGLAQTRKISRILVPE